ncbi:MAG: hypothetical protein WBN03_12715 [Desulfobacterales bacterium]
MRMGKSILGLTTIMFLVAGIAGFQTAFAADNGFLSRCDTKIGGTLSRLFRFFLRESK